jgi:metal-responsive CopG/Arc/MetJ family transcriptional regulator
MKTAISIPDELFREIDALARRSKKSRSALSTAAAEEYLARHGDRENATEAWNRLVDAVGQPADDRTTPAIRQIRQRTRSLIRRCAAKR